MKKIIIAACLILAGCGGPSGPGAITPPAPQAPPPPPPPPPPSPDGIVTQEFLTSPVLAHINADAAYRAGITGEGVVVAILEDGIDIDHPEFIGRIHPLSRVFGGDLNRSLKSLGEHGTRTGGIIAAVKNDIGTHGVAYDAQLLVLGVEDASDCFLDIYGVPKCTSFFGAIPEAIDFAVAQGVKIIMVQRGAGSQAAIDAAGLTAEFIDIQDAYLRGIAAGVLFIGPAGNGAVGDPLTASPVFFPFLAIGQLNGTDSAIIAVGSVDANNNLWVWNNSSGGQSQSHAAGAAAEYFLVAPSQAPYVKKDGTLTTNFRPGTSNSAPHVVGAAALLQQAFPNLTGRDIANILFESATDLGAPGTDPIFGRGLLNVEAALQPLGQTTTTTSLGQVFPMGETVASVSMAFGDAFSGAAALDQVIMLDKFDRSFLFDLGSQFYEPGQRGVNFDGLLASRDAVRSFGLPVGDGSSLGITFFNPDYGFAALTRIISPHRAAEFTRVQPLLFYSLDLSEELRLGLSLGISAGTLLDQNSAMAGYASLFTMASALRDQNPALSGDVWSAAVSRTVGDKFELSFGLTTASRDTNPLAGREPFARADKHATHEAITTLSYRTGKSLWRLKSALMFEEDTILGSRSSGALKLGRGATTLRASIEASRELGSKHIAFGFARHGLTSVDGAGGSFVSRLGSFRTSSFGLGLINLDVFRDGDLLGLSLSQPLRVESGRINLVVPTGRDYEADKLLYSDVGLGLAPSGREIDLEASYRVTLGGINLSASLMLTRHQGHNRQNGLGGNLLLRASRVF